MSGTREQFAADLHALVGRYNLKLLAPEIVGELGCALVNVLTSCPAEQRVAFSEGVFAILLREVRESLQ